MPDSARGWTSRSGGPERLAACLASIAALVACDQEGEEAVPRYRRMYEEESFGEHLPMFQSAFVDGKGRLWVGSAEWPEHRFSRTWSLFDPAGFWLGDLAAPEDVQIVDATSDLVLGIWRDEFDVPYVQLHRLRSEGSEP